MKYIFIGFFYFGFWHGWEMETKIFDTHDECFTYFTEMSAEVRFQKLNNQMISDWKLTCKPLRTKK